MSEGDELAAWLAYWDKCWTCRFWEDAGDESAEVSFCRRKSPRAALDGRAIFPETEKSDWCGEFQISDKNPSFRK